MQKRVQRQIKTFLRSTQSVFLPRTHFGAKNHLSFTHKNRERGISRLYNPTLSSCPLLAKGRQPKHVSGTHWGAQGYPQAMGGSVVRPLGVLHRGTPSLEWSVTLSGTEKFNDYKGEFNYMLSLTSSGYDGTITHAIYQQDTCIHNKPKAKH